MIPVDISLHATDQTGINFQSSKLTLQNSTSDSIDVVKEQKEFKPCACRGCENIGIHKLLIIYIDKIGWFCDSCKLELMKLQLVVE